MDKMKEILVGVLVIIAIIMCIMFIFTFGGFEKNRNYYQVKAIFGDVNSLEVGTPVILNGVKVGDVKDIYIENDKVAVILNIKKEIKIRKGARIAIMLKGLIGDLTVGIYNPKSGGIYIKDGDEILGIEPVSVNSLIEKGYDIMKMSDKLTETLEKIQVDQSVQDTKEIIKNIKDASEKLSATLDSTKKVMDNANEIMSQNKKGINDSVAATKELIKKIDAFIEKGDKDLTTVTRSIAETTKEIKELIAANKTDLNKSIKNFEKISSKTALILEKVEPSEVEKVKKNLIEITDDMKEIMKKINEISKSETGKTEEIKTTIKKAKESTDKIYAILNNKINFEGQIELDNDKKFSGNAIAEVVNKNSNIYIKGVKSDIDENYGKNSLTAGKYFKDFKVGAGLIKDKSGVEGSYYINKKLSVSGEYYDLKNSKSNIGADYEEKKYRFYFRYDLDNLYKVGAGYKF